MQKPLFIGTRPHIEDLGQYTLRPEVQMALVVAHKIRQQHNGLMLEAPQLDMARSLHWLLCLIHKGRGLEMAYLKLCSNFRSWHFRNTRKQRHKTFYQGRVKGMLAVLRMFDIVEGEIMSNGGGRTLPHFSLRLLNPDRIWGLYLPEPLRVSMISGADVRAAWDAYPAKHQLLLAASQRGLDWAQKHLAKGGPMDGISADDAALLQLFYQYPKTLDVAARRGFYFAQQELQRLLEMLQAEWAEYSRVTGSEFFKTCADKQLGLELHDIMTSHLRCADPEGRALELMRHEPPTAPPAAPPAAPPDPPAELEEIKALLVRLLSHLGAQ